MPSDLKLHRRRHNRSNTKWQAFILCLFLVLVLAALVGLILALNSKMFIEPR
jgi:uncharacterized membrane protein